MTAKNWILILVIMSGIISTFAQVTNNQSNTIPFGLTITKTQLDSLPDYLTGRSPDEWMDFPVSATRINGEFWVMLKNGETKPAYRFKGTNFEDAKRQPDGVISTPVSRPYILGGMWFDSVDQKLYAPLHCEKRGYYTTILRQIHLASSTDKGLTWKYEGPVMTRDDPYGPLPTGRESSGLYWDGGEGDFFLYADERTGYVYLYTNYYVWSKSGVEGPPFGFFTYLRHHVARCAIKDKLAPGKWQKFYNGGWEEPALGGKASEVQGYYVMYNDYLKKYISFNYNSSISFCTDLAKQDWSPGFKIAGDFWGCPPASAWHVLNYEKDNVYAGGKTLWLYSYWEKNFYGLYKIDFSKGESPANAGYFAGYAGQPVTTMDPSGLYLFQPRFESDDPIESRHTRRVSSTHPDLVYQGNWSNETSMEYYESSAKVSSDKGSQFLMTFNGTDVFWRAVKGPDCGKADVFIDGKLTKTVDCYASLMIPYQYAFIGNNLDPGREHVLKIIVKGEKNPKSSGSCIKNLVVEYSCESYRASDGFSSIQGKNGWYYQERTKAGFTDLNFTDPSWSVDDKTEIGYTQMIAVKGDAVRKWIAPHSGMVRIEGMIVADKPGSTGNNLEIMKNDIEIWPAKSTEPKNPASHDFHASVLKGDVVYFILKANSTAGGEKVSWDPVVTYL